MFVINIEETSNVDMSQCCVNIKATEIPFDEEVPSYNYTVINFLVNGINGFGPK